ncbi:hypothetical protein [Psychrobacter sp. AOP7-A1-24]|uniref:hypothetical protein n=1 Tax=Psychrobacter sp. AOP7-A1-24 TaxID=3457646 RepID=UPI00402BEB43
MKLSKILIALPLSLLSVSAIAGTADVNGSTKCTIIDSIIKNKAIVKACTYEDAIGGSMSYAISQLNFKLSNGNIYCTVDNATFDFNTSGKIQNLKETISLSEDLINLYHQELYRLLYPQS